jgi:NTE family protein
MNKVKKLGLALGGGGSLGLAHIGVLRVFEKNKIPISCITGSSIGAIMGAHYALYKDLKKLEEDSMAFIKDNSFKLFGINTVLEHGKQMRKIELFFEEIFGEKKFSDCKIPFSCTALDLESGKTVYLNKGNLKTAVMASMAVPGVFSPIFYWGRWFVDGGFLDPVPLNYLKNKKYDVLVGVDLHPHTFKQFPGRPSYIEGIHRTYRIFEHTMTKMTLEKIENKIIIKPKYTKVKDLFSIEMAQSYIKAGELGAKQQVKSILADLEK